MFCPNCGRANIEGDRFCANCGKPLSAGRAQAQAPARDSLEGSVNRLGIKTGPGVVKSVVVGSIVGLFVEYVILPFIGIGALTGYDPGTNALALAFISFLTSFAVVLRMRGGRRSEVRS